MIAISNRNDKYIAPSFVENKKSKQKKTTQNSKKKGPILDFMALLCPWMLPLVLRSKPTRKNPSNPSISIHALWLINFQDFFSPFLLIQRQITKTKRHQKHNKNRIISSIQTNKRHLIRWNKANLGIHWQSNTNTIYIYVKSVINRLKTIDTIYTFQLRQYGLFLLFAITAVPVNFVYWLGGINLYVIVTDDACSWTGG